MVNSWKKTKDAWGCCYSGRRYNYYHIKGTWVNHVSLYLCIFSCRLLIMINVSQIDRSASVTGHYTNCRFITCDYNSKASRNTWSLSYELYPFRRKLILLHPLASWSSLLYGKTSSLSRHNSFNIYSTYMQCAQYYQMSQCNNGRI